MTLGDIKIYVLNIEQQHVEYPGVNKRAKRRKLRLRRHTDGHQPIEVAN
jgi:hypothetical protein